ncbi:AP2-like ethylene-responsive transcription factor ANT [Cornus florida]|uniref:AP2-like ethylene-responsive transcription factor ANT n=1 Tax=Cornus florida TaxID=4283 RepID=UPI00289EB542|nr:AP2-like ethylene-responsive transcription factor ANT [Cornus florida]
MSLGSVGATISFRDLRSLSLSMSPGSQSSRVTTSRQISPPGAGCIAMETKKRRSSKVAQKQLIHRKSIDTFGQRTSQCRGVKRWCMFIRPSDVDGLVDIKLIYGTIVARRKEANKPARAYNLAALKYWGPSIQINFSLKNYQQELEEMQNTSRQEFVAHLRR